MTITAGLPVREIPVYLSGELACIEGTTTKIIEIVEVQQAHQLTPEEIQRELPHLTLTQVNAALAHYQTHKPEMDTQREQRRKFADELRASMAPNLPTRTQLKARLSHRV